MSLQSQSILDGHLLPDEVLTAIEKLSSCKVSVRQTHNEDYMLIEVEGPEGLEAMHLFLRSSTADDYRSVTNEPSTFVSVQYSPFSSDVVKRLTGLLGGYFRRTEQESWTRLDPRKPQNG